MLGKSGIEKCCGRVGVDQCWGSVVWRRDGEERCREVGNEECSGV